MLASAPVAALAITCATCTHMGRGATSGSWLAVCQAEGNPAGWISSVQHLLCSLRAVPMVVMQSYTGNNRMWTGSNWMLTGSWASACCVAVGEEGMSAGANLRWGLVQAQQAAEQHSQALLQGCGVGPQVGLVHCPVNGVQPLLRNAAH